MTLRLLPAARSAPLVKVAASSTSTLSHVPPTPYTPRIPQDKLGNQGMKLPAQTAAEWVVESVEVAHIVRKDGIQEVSAISSPHAANLTTTHSPEPPTPQMYCPMRRWTQGARKGSKIDRAEFSRVLRIRHLHPR